MRYAISIIIAVHQGMMPGPVGPGMMPGPVGPGFGVGPYWG